MSGQQQGERRLSAEAVNVMRLGQEAAAQRLAKLILAAGCETPGWPVQAIVAGVAGAGTLSVQTALASRIRAIMGAAAPPVLEVVHDGVIALEGAFPDSSGLLIIVGTGSAIVGRTRGGRLVRAGGWGYLMGDEGSGYALGRRALMAVARAVDGGPPTYLEDLLHQIWGIRGRAGLLDAIYVQRWPLQTAAPAVLAAAQEGDEVALHITMTEAKALGAQVMRLLERTPGLERRACLSGGLSASAWYCAVLRSALQTLRFCPPAESSAALAAARVAKELAQGVRHADALRLSDPRDG